VALLRRMEGGRGWGALSFYFCFNAPPSLKIKKIILTLTDKYKLYHFKNHLLELLGMG
jgi:hypothetical protein